MNTIPVPITPGATLYARSAADHNSIWKAKVLSRKGAWVIVHVEGEPDPVRRKVRDFGYGEFVMALGSYSMAPCFDTRPKYADWEKP